MCFALMSTCPRRTTPASRPRSVGMRGERRLVLVEVEHARSLTQSREVGPCHSPETVVSQPGLLALPCQMLQ